MSESANDTQPDGEEVIRVGSLAIRFLVEGADSNASVAMFECTVAAGGRAPAPHSHDGYEETIYGLDGVTTWTVADRTVDIGPGEAICIARGDAHDFENRGGSDARFLAVVSPGILGPDFFREVGAVVDIAADGPPDRYQIGAIMRRHGLTPAG